MISENNRYVLLTENNEYVFEYLFGSILFTNDISKAMLFLVKEKALKYQKKLMHELNLSVTVNTFID